MLEHSKKKYPVAGKNPCWYVIYSKPHQEAVAEEHLRRQSFEVYLPRASTEKRQRGVIRSSITAFFPRYLFVRFDAQCDDWAPIRSTRGVSALVKFQGVPKPVPDNLIAMLQANEDNQRIQKLAPKTWLPGDEVEIEQGPFAGYRCLFQAQRSADRVTVLLNIIGTATMVTLDKQGLQLPQFA